MCLTKHRLPTFVFLYFLSTSVHDTLSFPSCFVVCLGFVFLLKKREREGEREEKERHNATLPLYVLTHFLNVKMTIQV